MTATPGVRRRPRWPVRSGDSSMRSSASSSADVWNGFATTSAAPARSASTAPATEPCAVSASAVTAGRQARAFMITADPLPRRQSQVDDRDQRSAAAPSSAIASAALAVSTVACSHRVRDLRHLDGDRRVGADDEDLPCHLSCFFHRRCVRGA